MLLMEMQALLLMPDRVAGMIRICLKSVMAGVLQRNTGPR